MAFGGAALNVGFQRQIFFALVKIEFQRKQTFRRWPVATPERPHASGLNQAGFAGLEFHPCKVGAIATLASYQISLGNRNNRVMYLVPHNHSLPAGLSPVKSTKVTILLVTSSLTRAGKSVANSKQTPNYGLYISGHGADCHSNGTTAFDEDVNMSMMDAAMADLQAQVFVLAGLLGAGVNNDVFFEGGQF